MLVERKFFPIRQAEHLVHHPLTTLRNFADDVPFSLRAFDVDNHVAVAAGVSAALRLFDGGCEIGGRAFDGPDVLLNRRMTLNLRLRLVGDDVHAGVEEEVASPAAAESPQHAE